jgi:hypothetical protein
MDANDVPLDGDAMIKAGAAIWTALAPGWSVPRLIKHKAPAEAVVAALDHVNCGADDDDCGADNDNVHAYDSDDWHDMHSTGFITPMVAAVAAVAALDDVNCGADDDDCGADVAAPVAALDGGNDSDDWL